MSNKIILYERETHVFDHNKQNMKKSFSNKCMIKR